ncbi:MAG: hypothetical protein PVH02_13365 [Desulfobacteraceae bacterium]|jgi:hypothetical protein
MIRDPQRKERPYVFESITIALPKTMPRRRRISEASEQISEWLLSLERPFNYKTNMLRLKKFEQTDKEYIYHYEIHGKVED